MNPLEIVIDQETLANQSLEGTQLQVIVWSLILERLSAYSEQALAQQELIIRGWARFEWGPETHAYFRRSERTVTIISGKRVVTLSDECRSSSQGTG